MPRAAEQARPPAAGTASGRDATRPDAIGKKATGKTATGRTTSGTKASGGRVAVEQAFDAAPLPLPLPPPRRAWRRLPDWRQLTPPEPTLEATIIMPVRNEAAGLRATLDALARQREFDGRRLDPRRYEVIVLANNCTDASAEIVRRCAARRRSFRVQVVEVTFPRPVAHVGHARRVLMDEACRRLEAGIGARGVIVSTDGDTLPAPDWLAATLAEIAAGADAVGGQIGLDGSEFESKDMARLVRRDALYHRLRSRLEHLLDPDPADPWPRHHQHFGASLALTVSAYRHVGGLPPERFLEDEALYQSLRAHDLSIRHSQRVRVVTSSRRDGRVDVGLSWQLRVWSDLVAGEKAAADPLVCDPASYARELLLKRQLRACWRASAGGTGASSPEAGIRLAAVAEALGLNPRWLARRVRASRAFGSLWLEVIERRARQRQSPAPVPMPMREAIATLRRLTSRGVGQPKA